MPGPALPASTYASSYEIQTLGNAISACINSAGGAVEDAMAMGRLIRAKTDTGIVVVLDNRILTKKYGQAFLASIPKCPVEVV